jgi:signal peptidase I
MSAAAHVGWRLLVISARVALATVVLLAVWARVPTVFGCRSVVVDGGSMRPALEPGDVAVACPTHTLRAGTVALVDDPARPGELLTHRIVAVARTTITLKGDANRQQDHQTVPATAVHGVVRLVVPGIGLPAHWLNHGSWGRVLAAAAALVVLVMLATGDAIALLLLPSSMRTRRERARRVAAQARVDIAAEEPFGAAGAPP